MLYQLSYILSVTVVVVFVVVVGCVVLFVFETKLCCTAQPGLELSVMLLPPGSASITGVHTLVFPTI